MRRYRIAKGIAANIFDRAVIAGIQLAIVPVLAVHWGHELYGAWVIMATIPQLLVLSDLGFTAAATSRMAGQIARGETEAAQTTLHSASQIVLVASLAILVTATAAIWLVPDTALIAAPGFSAMDVRVILWLLTCYGLAILSGAIFSAVFRSRQEYPLATLLWTSTYLTENGLCILAVITGYGPLIAAVALLVGRLAGNAVGYLLMRRRVPDAKIGVSAAQAGERKLLMRPAIAAMAITFGHSVVLQGSVIALGMAAGAVAVPAFVAARTLSRTGLQLSQMLALPLMPEFSAATARQEARQINAMLIAVTGSSTLVSIPIAATLAFFGPQIVSLWTHGEITASPALMATMGVSALFTGLWNPMSNMILAINRQAAFSYAYLVLGLGVIGSIYVAARDGGAEAAALSFAVLDFAMCIVVGRFAWRHWLSSGDWRGTFAELSGFIRKWLLRRARHRR